MNTRIFRWVGCDKTGRARTGSRVGNPAPFVEAKFREGWRSLKLVRDRVEVGGITRHLDTGQRTWWSEDDDTLVPVAVGGTR